MEGLLFIPCVTNKLNNTSKLQADYFIFDLEDSIREGNKETALTDLVDYLNDNEDLKRNIVRVNSERLYDEINTLYGCGIRRFMIPKAETTEDINKLSELYKDISLVLLVETPRGLINLETMIQYNNVYAVAFGAEDFCTSIQMSNLDELLLPIKQRIVILSKAYNKKVYDTITLEIRDAEKINKKVVMSRNLGFDGKLLIHPKQLEVVAELNNAIDYDKYKKIVAEFDKSKEGIIIYEGKVYEKPHIEFMRRCINEKE